MTAPDRTYRLLDDAGRVPADLAAALASDGCSCGCGAVPELGDRCESVDLLAQGCRRAGDLPPPEGRVMAVLRLHLPHRRPRPLPCHLAPCADCRAAGRIWFSTRQQWHEAQWRARSRRALLRLAIVLAALAAAIAIGVIA